MTDITDIKECTAHGYHVGAICPRCDKSATKTREKAPKRNDTPQVHISTSNRIMWTYSSYRKLSPNKVSKEEYNRYVYLFGLQQAGIIQNLETQISYDLIPKLKVGDINWYTHGKRKGFTQSAQTYSPDFRYQYDGVTIIEEYKAVKKTKAGNLVPRINTTARNKVKLWIAKYAEYIQSGAWFLCISGWYRNHGQYYVFDPNGNIIDYPLANYIEGMEDAA